jgi:hypothetical protein
MRGDKQPFSCTFHFKPQKSKTNPNYSFKVKSETRRKYEFLAETRDKKGLLHVFNLISELDVPENQKVKLTNLFYKVPMTYDNKWFESNNDWILFVNLMYKLLNK